MEHWLQWAIAVLAFLITVVFKAEVALLFIGAGLVGLLHYGTLFRGRGPMTVASVAPIAATGAVPHVASASIVSSLRPAASHSVADL